MKRAVGPIGDLRYVSVFHRIEMNVIDVALQIAIVTDRMFPVPALPKASLASRQLAGRPRRIQWEAARKAGFDQAPAQREIRISVRHLPDRVQMVRQHADCDRLEWIALLRGRIHPAQSVDVPDQQIAGPVGERDREEEYAAFNPGTAIA